MNTTEVLKRVPGIDKRTLYYWESLGLINPKKVKKKRIERRDYSQNDLQKIQLIWKFYEQGFPPLVAFQKAVGERLKDYLENGKSAATIISEFGGLKRSPKSIPSGLAGFEIKVGDHIALINMSDSDKYHEILLDMLIAALGNRTMEESCFFEVDRSGESARQDIIRSIEKAGLTDWHDRLRILTWEETMSSFPNGCFSPKLLEKIMEEILGLVKAVGSREISIRFITENTSKVMTHVNNPEAMFEFERNFHEGIWLFPFGLTALCVYKKEDLLALQQGGRFSFNHLIAEVLKSHNRLIVVTEEDEVMCDLRAASYLFRKCPGMTSDVQSK
jgi:hypothetical protein